MKENESITTKVKRHFSRRYVTNLSFLALAFSFFFVTYALPYYYFYSKSADFICTDHAPHEYCYWTVSIPPVSRDIACFPYPSSSEVNFTEFSSINRKNSVVSRLPENNDNVIAVSRW